MDTIDVFPILVTEKMLHEIVEVTNLYSMQNDGNSMNTNNTWASEGGV